MSQLSSSDVRVVESGSQVGTHLTWIVSEGERESGTQKEIALNHLDCHYDRSLALGEVGISQGFLLLVSSELKTYGQFLQYNTNQHSGMYNSPMIIDVELWFLVRFRNCGLDDECLFLLEYSICFAHQVVFDLKCRLQVEGDGDILCQI